MQLKQRQQHLLISSVFFSFEFYYTWCYTTVISSETPGWHPPFSKLLSSQRAAAISAFCCLLCSSPQSSGEAGGAEKSCCLTEGSPFLKEDLPVLDLEMFTVHYNSSQCLPWHYKYFLTLPKGIPLLSPFYKRLHLHCNLHELIVFSDLDPPRYVLYAERIDYSISRCRKCYFCAFPPIWGICGRLRRNLVCDGVLLCTW